jgi:hypothetical protein
MLALEAMHVSAGFLSDGLIDDLCACRWGARQDDADWGDRGGRCVRDREDLEDVPVPGRHRLRLLLLQRPHRNPGTNFNSETACRCSTVTLESSHFHLCYV